MTISGSRHPPGAFKMCHPGSARPLWLAVSIDVQDDFRDFLPVCTIAIGIEKAEVSNCVLFIVDRECIGLRRCVGHVRIKWRPLHDVFPPLSSF
jgi:hypothetical protein